MLSLRKVSKRFGALSILDDISLEVRSGESLLLLGSNGAGKSTLLRICAGLVAPTSGTIDREKDVRFGYVGHSALLYGALTLEENIRLFASLLGCTSNIDDEINYWDLTSQKKKSIDSLSQGQRARASLLRAFLGDPSLVLLDEPTSALDDKGTALLFKKIATHSEKKAVLIASHDIERVSPHVKSAAVLQRGTLLSDSQSKEEAINRYRRENR